MNSISTLLMVGLALLELARAAEPIATAAESGPLRYFIVVTGGELLEGVYPDAHTPFLTRTLRPLGCQCAGSMTVDDQKDEIQRAVRYAISRAPLVIVTGGLGPTPNDITRETLADLTGIELRESAEALGEIERRLGQSKDQLRPNLRRQAMAPSSGRFLKNPNGSAVGLVFDWGDSVLVALPGPPRELQPMASGELVSFLRQRFGVREFGSSLTLRFVGAGQSLIDQTIKDHVKVPPDVVITSLFEGSRVDFTFSLPGKTPSDRDRLQGLEGDIRRRLDPYIYSDDGSSLEDVVIEQLRARGGSLVLAELGSGGTVAAALMGSKGGGDILSGAYVALTEDAMVRLLDSSLKGLPTTMLDRMKRLASDAATKTGSEWAVATSPVDVAADGSKSLWVVCKLPTGTWEIQRIPLRDSGEITRAPVTTQILDFLRKCSQPYEAKQRTK